MLTVDSALPQDLLDQLTVEIGAVVAREVDLQD